MDIKNLYDIFKQHPVITTDSRDCPSGSIFFALKGATFDGNAYAKTALEKGCSHAIIDDNKYADPTDQRIILVDNALKTLQALANYHRKVLGTIIIGITGTNGKTTTKELTAAVLQKKYRVLYTQGNFNNSIGVPKTLLRLTHEHELAVIEMGASHPGDIKELVDIVEPNYGLITNVGKAHLLGFGSFEGVIHTKGELYDYLRHHDGTAFINADNPHLLGISHGIPLIRYGQQELTAPLKVKGNIIDCNPFLHFSWNGHDVMTHLIGAYNLDNVLAAATIGLTFHVPDNDISQALADYIPSNNRSQFEQTADNDLVVDAYNANPTSMRASIENFLQMNAKHKMCILGDMGELGKSSQEEHTSIVRLLKTCDFEQIWLVGKEFAKVEEAQDNLFRLFDNVEDVKAVLTQNKPHGMTILVKGSNSTHLYQLPPLL